MDSAWSPYERNKISRRHHTPEGKHQSPQTCLTAAFCSSSRLNEEDSIRKKLFDVLIWFLFKSEETFCFKVPSQYRSVACRSVWAFMISLQVATFWFRFMDHFICLILNFLTFFRRKPNYFTCTAFGNLKLVSQNQKGYLCSKASHFFSNQQTSLTIERVIRPEMRNKLCRRKWKPQKCNHQQCVNSQHPRVRLQRRFEIN